MLNDKRCQIKNQNGGTTELSAVCCFFVFESCDFCKCKGHRGRSQNHHTTNLSVRAVPVFQFVSGRSCISVSFVLQPKAFSLSLRVVQSFFLP